MEEDTPSHSRCHPFLLRRGLSFGRTAEGIGDIHNGNSLEFITFLRKYDAILADHVERVRNAQENNIRIQVYYLSCESQNESIEICGLFAQKDIINEIKAAKYYAIGVDGTSDCSHKQ